MTTPEFKELWELPLDEVPQRLREYRDTFREAIPPGKLVCIILASTLVALLVQIFVGGSPQ